MSIRDEVVRSIQTRRSQIEGLGVRRLLLFGSVARGEDGPNSDIDILVEFAGPPSFDGYMDLKFLLEDALGRAVDLVTVGGLRGEIRAEVLSQALRVA